MFLLLLPLQILSLPSDYDLMSDSKEVSVQCLMHKCSHSFSSCKSDSACSSAYDCMRSHFVVHGESRDFLETGDVDSPDSPCLSLVRALDNSEEEVLDCATDHECFNDYGATSFAQVNKLIKKFPSEGILQKVYRHLIQPVSRYYDEILPGHHSAEIERSHKKGSSFVQLSGDDVSGDISSTLTSLSAEKGTDSTSGDAASTNGDNDSKSTESAPKNGDTVSSTESSKQDGLVLSVDKVGGSAGFGVKEQEGPKELTMEEIDAQLDQNLEAVGKQQSSLEKFNNDQGPDVIAIQNSISQSAQKLAEYNKHQMDIEQKTKDGQAALKNEGAASTAAKDIVSAARGVNGDSGPPVFQ